MDVSVKTLEAHGEFDTAKTEKENRRGQKRRQVLIQPSSCGLWSADAWLLHRLMMLQSGQPAAIN